MRDRFREPPHRSNRFECERLDVVFPRDTIVGVTEHHRCDGFAHADPLKVCCKAAPEAVPAFPLARRSLAQMFKGNSPLGKGRPIVLGLGCWRTAGTSVFSTSMR